MTTGDDFSSGVIDPSLLYTIKALTRKLGIREATLRSARRAGLRVHYVHKRAFVFGADWIDYVRSSQDRRNGEPFSEAG